MLVPIRHIRPHINLVHFLGALGYLEYTFEGEVLYVRPACNISNEIHVAEGMSSLCSMLEGGIPAKFSLLGGVLVHEAMILKDVPDNLAEC